MRRQIQPVAPEGQAAQVASIMRWTPWVFPLGMILGGLFFGFPIAILLYWLTQNVWTMAQQHLVYRRMDAEERACRGGRVSGAVRRAAAAPSE